MIIFIIKRISLIIPMILLVSLVIFTILRLGPVDPALAYLLNSRVTPSQETLDITRKELGLDKSFTEQYIVWLKNALKLDFGRSYTTKRDVLEDILYYFPTTLKLAVSSMLIVIILSIPLGILAALNQNKIIDKLLKLLSFIGVSTPTFWIGFLLIYIFSIKFNILPSFGNDGPISYIMPVITLSIMSVAINIRLTRTSFLEHLNQRSVVYFRAIGMTEQKIIGKYTLKNSMLPIITSLGMHFGELLGGAVIVESLFAWPGVGRHIINSITNYDYPVIQCFMIIVTIIFILINLTTDIIYAYLNPKISYNKE